jgi:hypothetical protein
VARSPSFDRRPLCEASRGLSSVLALEVEASPGRPSVPIEVRRLGREMSLANLLWGAPRIHGELLKLGLDVGQTSVAKYIVRRRRPPSQGWAPARSRRDGRPALQVRARCPLAEGGVNITMSTWYGVWAPANTPSAIVERLQRDIIAVLQGDDVQSRLRILDSRSSARPVTRQPLYGCEGKKVR